MKLTLVISSLAGGGAERVMATLANAWAASGMAVTLVTLATTDSDSYALDSRVRRLALGVMGESSNVAVAVRNNLRRLRALRSVIRTSRPDAIVSFMDTVNVLTILACTGLRIPVVVSDRTAVSASPPRGIWSYLYRRIYQRAAAVVAQTPRAASAITALTHCVVDVIPNPVRVAGFGAACHHGAVFASSSRRILAMGRLQPEKGFDLLLQAFSRVAGDYPQWQLEILGEGPERERLATWAEHNGLVGRVEMPGFVTEPEKLLRGADLFVLSSRFEGFPNALLEAMAEGITCISFDCPAGPREMIEHGVSGWLVAKEDVKGLASGLAALMQDADLRARLGAQATKVRETYALPVILAQWNALLLRVLRSCGC